MKTDIVLYERIYQLIRSQIECGLLPEGSKLPSRADLCEEFHVSAKTVRSAVERLAEEGLIETSQRKLAVVRGSVQAEEKHDNAYLLVDKALAVDLFHTGRLICFPVIEQGIRLCTGEEWKIPLAIAEKMDPADSLSFWRCSRKLWRFFIARNGNDLILRVVDSLGFSKIDPLPGTLELRKSYLADIKKLIQYISCGGRPEKFRFEDMSFLYGLSDEGTLGTNLYRVAPDSPLRTDLMGLEQQIRSAEERYSRVYMDILGLIDIGRYQPGDRLPSHLELQKAYKVSADTTNKAIRVLQDWGVVTARRGSGIYVAMDLEALKKAPIPEKMIACHLRRFLDSIELLSLTVREVALHAAVSATPDEAKNLKAALRRHWNEEYMYQRAPVALLEFITQHIQYKALREIYQVILENYRISRCIPKLVTPLKTDKNAEIHQRVMETAEHLLVEDKEAFSEKTSELYRDIQQMIIGECKKLGYWQIAEQVYDGGALWQERNILKPACKKEALTKLKPNGFYGRTKKTEYNNR
ncbi:GntR family transcriptional regulator [Lachnotalea sp. AF33-28]|uniref:GntR family transcriptional regulator n=1 Tax=Lachnotalea sp. AF33-28 TaxID=2292046 RepID=UPI000E4C706A|nr:GntR family transcriptional regulator [Lachnotalea sp. AF33-28]RHP36497.1 GntR family transcriptional regulator [Lachnotalea sp. AF33-28]